MKEIILFHYGEEKNKEYFSPLTEDSMSLTFFFSQFNLCPCVVESGSVLNAWFDTAACCTPSTSFLFPSQSPDVLGPLQGSLMIHIFGTTLSMKKVQKTEDNTCITQNILLTHTNGNLWGQQDLSLLLLTLMLQWEEYQQDSGFVWSPLWGSSAHPTDTVATFRLLRCETLISV